VNHIGSMFCMSRIEGLSMYTSHCESSNNM